MVGALLSRTSGLAWLFDEYVTSPKVLPMQSKAASSISLSNGIVVTRLVGLDPINERGVSPAPGNGLHMMQAFSQLGEPTSGFCVMFAFLLCSY